MRKKSSDQDMVPAWKQDSRVNARWRCKQKKKRTVNDLAHAKVFLIGNEHAAVRVDADAHRKAKIRRVRCAVRKVLATRAGQRRHHTWACYEGVCGRRVSTVVVSKMQRNVHTSEHNANEWPMSPE
jgi:hypothetical protein